MRNSDKFIWQTFVDRIPAEAYRRVEDDIYEIHCMDDAWATFPLSEFYNPQRIDQLLWWGDELRKRIPNFSIFDSWENTPNKIEMYGFVIPTDSSKFRYLLRTTEDIELNELSFAVTEGHRMRVRLWDGGFKAAEDIAGVASHRDYIWRLDDIEFYSKLEKYVDREIHLLFEPM